MATTIDEAKLKEMLKAAVVEALHEQRDLVKDIVEEAMEEIALTRAMDEGLRSRPIPREEVLAILEGGR
ncbi:MAG: hypothetical protein ACR2HX_10010 [Pyrinomonadaceae bacterium]